jgi:hypothetical protein
MTQQHNASTLTEKADALAKYLRESGVFDTVERTGNSGIRVEVWTWDEVTRYGETVRGLIVVSP